MDRYAKVQSSLWTSSKKFKNLNPSERYVYLYLLTCQHGNSAGIYRMIPSYSAYDCKIDLEDYDRAIDSLCIANLISFDKEMNIVFIHQYMKFNPVTNNKHAIGTAKVASEFKESSVYATWANEAKEYFKGFDSVIHSPIHSPIDSQSIQENTDKRIQIREKKEPIVKSKAFNEDSFEMKVVDGFILHLQSMDSKFKLPDKNKWCEEIEKLKRIDNRTEEEIINVLRFAMNDHFWKTNILSTAKLRKQFGALVLKMPQSKTIADF